LYISHRNLEDIGPCAEQYNNMFIYITIFISIILLYVKLTSNKTESNHVYSFRRVLQGYNKFCLNFEQTIDKYLHKM